MKKYLFIGLISCLGLSSCDVLDVTPVSIISSDSFWKSSSDADAYLTGIYNRVRSLYNTSYYAEDRGDAFKAGEIGPVSMAWSHKVTESNAPSYRSAYTIIHHTNLLFYQLDNLKISDEKNKARIQAQCHVLRALTYFFLVRSWGDVPLVVAPTLSDEVELQPRTPKKQIMEYILTDLDEALQLFPEEGYNNKNYISKPAAYAVKADALMWNAKVLKSGAADLNEAIRCIQKVEESGVRLLPDYAAVFDNNNKKNDEIIFSFYFDRDETGNLSIALNTTSRTDNLSMAVNLSDAATSPNNSRHVYAPSDKLREMYLKNPGDLRYASAMIDLVDAAGKLILTQQNKFRGKQYTDDRFFDDDLVMYRWGGLLLLRAEAYAALEQIDNALKDLDAVRNRAGLPAYDGSREKNKVEKEICDERGRELFLEGKRWFDLMRFHAGGTIDIYQEVPNLNDKAGTPLYLPINYNDMVLNECLVQTEGYESSFDR